MRGSIDDLFWVGCGIFVAALGIGFCLSWAFEDPVIEGCKDTMRFFEEDADQLEALIRCLDGHDGKFDFDLIKEERNLD